MKKGITIIEVIVSVAILGIFFLLIAPSIKSYRGIRERVEIQKEIDKKITNESVYESHQMSVCFHVDSF